MYDAKYYISDVLRSENKDYNGMLRRIETVDNIRLLHGGMGISTEAGELLDALKKHIFYGKKLDYVNISEELGDILYYISICMNVLGISFEEVMEKNIEKLKARYPEKFTEDKAINRDLDTERKILENDQIPKSE